MTPSQSTANQESAQSVLDFMHARSEKFADRAAMCIKDGGDWRALSYGELSQKVIALSSYFIENGIQQGDRIAILSESKPEWGIAFFGCIRAGAVVVPLDVKLTETELVNILGDCTPNTVLADTKHLNLIDEVKKKVTSIKNVYCVDGGDDAHASMDSLKPKEREHGRERSLEEVALIVYTSGTTGNPKGVMTTFGNLIFQVSSFEEMVGLSENDRFLSILPLNHLLELTGGFLGLLTNGGTVCFSHSLFPQEIIKAMKEKQITGMVSVPLFFKSLKGAIERELRKKGEEAVAQFQGGLQKATQLPMEQRRQMFAQVHEQFGGKLRVFVCGGAPLDVEVAEFFERLGVAVLQGYGLTETSPVISGNSLKANRLGSVGQPLPGVEVKIDAKGDEEEGEVLSRGPHIMKGYYKRDDLTKEVIDSEGWFHTGDIGKLDADNFLYITGRIKNLIVLGGGKKVFPEEVEAAFAEAKTIKECCVCSRTSSDGFKEGTEEVCVVVVPSDTLVSENKDQPEAVKQAIKKEVEELGQHLAPYKRPTRIFVHEGELPKTPTRKIKRPLVKDWLATQS
jgi:long-chain acyl-CoA synthetase